MLTRRIGDTSAFLANLVSKQLPTRDAPYILAVSAAAELKVMLYSPSNWLGKNKNKGANPRQTTALIIIKVLNFIARLFSKWRTV
jgi:hypothetical protein